MNEIDYFLNAKERALIKLNNAENENKLDEDIFSNCYLLKSI